jgi:autotransporter-associated beta strand protein
MHARSIPLRYSLRLAATALPGLLFALATGPGARAATGNDTWIGATDGNWSTATNWFGANTPPQPGDTLVFGAAGSGGLTLNNNLAAATSYLGLTFNGTAPAFILNGNSLVSTGGIVDNSSSLETIDLSLEFDSTHSLNATSGGSMVINGPITGAGGITKTGNGLVTLTGATSGANTFTGITSVNTGILKLDFTTGGSTPATNVISASSALSVGGGNLWVKGASASSTQTFASTAVAAGQSIITATGSSTITLNAITPVAGGVVEFVGPATVGAGEVAVPATGTITTTTAGAGTFGLLTATAAGLNNSAFSTVGLYDWASTDLAGGTAGTSPYTLLGGSQVTGFYTNFGNGTQTLAGNANLTTGTTNSHNTDTPATVRIDVAASVTLNLTAIVATGGILVTPNVGANNIILSGIANDLQAGNRGGAAQTVLWQNNVLGFLNNGVGFSDAKSGVGTLVQAGPGTINYTIAASYTGQTYLDGGLSLLNQNANLGIATTGAQLNLSGGTIVANGTFTLDNAGANLRPIALGTNGGAIAALTGNTITVDGVISGAGSLAAGTNLITGTGAGTANAVALYGNGIVKLTGTNTYTGGTVITNGTLNFGASSLGSGGVTLNGGTLQWATGVTTDITAGNVVTFNSGGGNLDTNANNVTLATANITGTGALTKLGNGVLTLGTGVTAPSGGVTVSRGSLTVTSGAQLNSGAVSVITPGILNIGTSSTVAGALTINGTLTPGNAGTGSGAVTTLNFGSNLNLNSGATLNFDLTNTSSFDQFLVAGALNITGGAGTITLNLYNTGANTPYTTPGQYELLQYGSLGGTGSAASLISPTEAGYTYTYDSTTNPGFITLTISAAGSVFAWNTGAGFWSTGSNWNLVTGVTSPPPNGAGQTATFDTTGTGGTITLDVPVTLGTLKFNDAAQSYTIASDGTHAFTLDNSGNTAIVTDLAGNHTVAPNLALNSPVSVNVTNPGDTLTISGSISDLGSHTLTKVGNGTLALSGTNTYGPAAGTVGTILSAGTLQVASNAALSTGDLSVTGNNTLQAGAATVALPNNIIIGNGLVLTTDTQTDALTLNGIISDTSANGVLNVIGNGTLVLTATNTYGGGTVLYGGTTNINSASSLGASTGTLTFNGGALQLGAAIPVTTRNYVVNAGQNAIIDTNGFSLADNGTISAINGLGGLTKLGAGNLTLNNANTFNGTTTIDAGILQLGNSTALQSSTLNYGNFGGALDFSNLTAVTLGGLSGNQNLVLTNDTPAAVGLTVGNNNSTTTYSGNLSSTGGSLTKVGSGTLTLTGNNTYTGATNINAGTIAIGTGGAIHGAAINPTGLIQVSGGVLTSSALSTITGGFGLGFAISSGSANFTAGMVSQANDGAEILVTGGTLTTTDINLRRTNNSITVASPTSGLVISGGAVNINTLELGTENSSSSANITGGSLTTSGAVTVANQTSGGRGGVIDVSGGFFTVNDTVNGLVLVRNNGTGTNQNANVFLSGGTTTLGKLSFGFDNTVFAGSFANVTLSGSASLYIGSGGIAQNGLPANLSSNLLLNGGILGAIADWSSSMPMVLGGSTIQAADSTGLAHNITISGNLSGTVLPKTGGGILSLAGTNTYTGATTVNAGTLSITNVANGSLPSALGASTSDPSNLILTDSTLQYTGPTASTDRSFTVSDLNATLDASGSGNLTFSNTTVPVTFSGAGAATLTFTGNNTGSNTFVPVIADGAGPTSVVKNGPGQWVLSGTNTYSGNTTVNAGTLVPTLLINSNVTVNSGATLSGPGTVGGSVALNSNTTFIPGGSGVGSFAANSLSLASNVALDFIFANISSYDQVIATNSLSFSPNLSITLLTTSLTPLTSTGNYTIFTFGSGLFTGDPNDLSVTNQQVGLDYSFVVNNTNNGIVLEIASQGLLNSWNSTIGGSWATGSNWSNGDVPPSDVIINFYSAITQNSTITLDGNRTAEGLRFSNNFSYTIADALGDNSNLTLSNGASNATIQVLAGNHTISAPVMLTAGGLATNITSGSILTISGAIGQTATAALTNIGGGNLILSGANTYTGPTNVDAGTVSVTALANGGSPSSLGQSSNAASNLVINGGTLRYIGSGSSTDRLLTLGSSGGRISASGTGPVDFTNTGSLAFSTPDVPVTLTLSGSNTGTNTFSPTINDNGAGSTSLTKSGTGLWLVNGNNTQTGVTTISGGTLQITTLANGTISQSSTTFGPAAEPSCQTSSGSTNIFIGDTSTLTANMTVTGPGIPANDTIATVNGDGSIDLVTPANSTATVSLNFSGVPVVTVSDSTQFTVGETVSGSGIPTGSTILSIDNTQDTVTLSQNATATSSSVSLNFFTANAFGDTTNAAANLVIDGGTLQYVGPAASTDRLFTIGLNGTTIDSSGSGPVNFANSGSLAFVGTTSTSLTLTGNNTGSNILAAAITDSSPGLTSVIKSGPGVWNLSGSNTYSGGTNITAGTLQVTSDSNLGATSGNVTIGSGTLETQSTFSTTRNFVLTSTHSDIMVDDGLSLTIGSNITGTGTLNFLGQNGPLGSTLFLSFGSAYTGGTIINGGTVSISNTTALGTGGVTLLNNSSLTVTDAPQSLANNITIPAGDTGNLTFTNAASASYSGTVTGSTSSTLNFGASGNPTTLNGSATQFGGFNGTLNLITTGAGSVRLFGPTNFANTTINLESNTGSLFPRTSGTFAIGALEGIPGSTIGSASNDALTSIWQIGSLNTNTTFSGNFTQGTSLTSINKVGTGILTLNGTNNISGNITYTAGEINFSSLSNLGNGTQNFNGGALQWAAGTTTDISTLPVFFNTGGATFDTNGNAITLANPVGGNGPGGLTIAGSGSVTLDGADPYNGSTTVSAGSLILNNPVALPSNTTVSVTGGAALNVNGFATTVGSISGAGQILLGEGGSLTTGGNNLTTTFNGMISGPSDLGIVKTGTGTLTLGGTSTYNGATLINAGNLVLTGTLANSNSVTVASGAFLSGNGTIANGLTLNTGGKLYLGPAGANTLTVGSFTWNSNGSGSLLYVLQDLTTTDLLQVNGSITKGTNPGGTGQFVFDFQNTGFFNGVYTLIDFTPNEDNGFNVSDFAAINLRNGDAGVFDLNDANGTLTFNITVPEPSTWALLTGASALLLALRRRRRNPSA